LSSYTTILSNDRKSQNPRLSRNYYPEIGGFYETRSFVKAINQKLQPTVDTGHIQK
jgi:hypothetical protein